MSDKIQISRELAHKLARNLASGSEAYSAQEELCKILAAPVQCRECMGTGGFERMETCRHCKGTGKQ